MHRPYCYAALLFIVATAGSSARQTPAHAQALAVATEAWANGDYLTALNGYTAVLNGPDGDVHHDAIALQTGELFRTTELTHDGRGPRFSPDGRHIAYETGLEVSRRTRIVRTDGSHAVVADLPGVSATFSPTTATVAYLKIVDTPELVAAARAVDEAPLAGQNRNPLLQALTWQVWRSNVIVTRDLATQQEREWPAPGLLKAGLTFGADGRTLYFLGGTEADESRNDIYAITDGGAPVRVTTAEGIKGVLTVAGGVGFYVPPPLNVFRRPQAPGAGAGGAGAGGGPGATPRPPSFGVIDLASGQTRTIDGTAPALSADGATLAYIARAGSEYHLMVGAPLGPAAAIRQGLERLDAPALSPDGQRLAYQLMTRDDWEIFLAEGTPGAAAAQRFPRDRKADMRLSRDIQHDVLPRFLTGDRLVALVGEARHRRSYLYDLTNGTRTRLFHNNTVRTIAPEYQWAPNRDGSMLLIGAERDGDTVSLERGVYALDLRQKITKADLLARLRANIASETALRDGAALTFGPINAAVKAVVDAVSVPRIYGYEKALFDFDSKHITQPGNKLAAEYLFKTYESFGYQPEYQWFDNRAALGGKTANVLATLKGTTNPELVYVVSSHFDSVAGGPGADDDSSGTAALLEAARVLAGRPLPATIVFASFTGEESGLLGSREYVRQAVANKTRIVGALNNDMIGWSGDDRLDNTIRYSNPGIRDVQHGAAMLFTKLITYDSLYFKSTDAAAYYDAYGDIVGGIGSYPVLSNPHYHQPHDLLEFVNHQLIAETSKTTVATLMLLASSPSRITNLAIATASAKETSISWTASPEKGVVSYLVSYRTPGTAPRQLSVKTPHASLPPLAKGTVVSVKAMNKAGLTGWDWARATVR